MADKICQLEIEGRVRLQEVEPCVSGTSITIEDPRFGIHPVELAEVMAQKFIGDRSIIDAQLGRCRIIVRQLEDVAYDR